MRKLNFFLFCDMRNLMKFKKNQQPLYKKNYFEIRKLRMNFLNKKRNKTNVNQIFLLKFSACDGLKIPIYKTFSGWIIAKINEDT